MIVLIVEDSRDIRRELGRLVLAAGATAWEAGSLAEARLHLEAGDPRPDVVIADRRLPDGDGATLYDAGIPLVLLTGDDDLRHPPCALWLVKPLSLAVVARLVVDLVRHRGDREPLEAVPGTQ